MLLSYTRWNIYLIGETLSIVGRTCIDYWNQLLGKVLSHPMPEWGPPDTIIYRTENAHTRNIVLPLGMMDASSKVTNSLNKDLSGERIMKMNMRKYRGKDEKLNICKLRNFELYQIQFKVPQQRPKWRKDYEDEYEEIQRQR